MTERSLVDELTGALRFIIAFYEPGQRHLDTEAWKHAEAGGRRALARGEAALAAPPVVWENGYKTPFKVECDKNDVVTIFDADYCRIADFNEVTQTPLDDEAGLREERDMWMALANQIASAMNSYQPGAA